MRHFRQRQPRQVTVYRPVSTKYDSMVSLSHDMSLAVANKTPRDPALHRSIPSYLPLIPGSLNHQPLALIFAKFNFLLRDNRNNLILQTLIIRSCEIKARVRHIPIEFFFFKSYQNLWQRLTKILSNLKPMRKNSIMAVLRHLKKCFLLITLQ